MFELQSLQKMQKKKATTWIEAMIKGIDINKIMPDENIQVYQHQLSRLRQFVEEQNKRLEILEEKVYNVNFEQEFRDRPKFEQVKQIFGLNKRPTIRYDKIIIKKDT